MGTRAEHLTTPQTVSFLQSLFSRLCCMVNGVASCQLRCVDHLHNCLILTISVVLGLGSSIRRSATVWSALRIPFLKTVVWNCIPTGARVLLDMSVLIMSCILRESGWMNLAGPEEAGNQIWITSFYSFSSIDLVRQLAPSEPHFFSTPILVLNQLSPL